MPGKARKFTPASVQRATPKRKSAYRRGYTKAWQKAAAVWLDLHPLCAACERNGVGPTAASVVDHVIPHRGNQVLFWDPNNWQALCKPCHDEKTGRGL